METNIIKTKGSPKIKGRKDDFIFGKIVIDDYLINKLNHEQITKKYKLSPRNFYYILDKNNVVRRPMDVAKRIYKANYSYFNDIDSSEKAYWLGFVYADGTNSKNNNLFQIRLSIKDKQHILLFKKCIKSEHKITYAETNDPFGYGGGEIYKSAILNISSKEISQALKKLGINGNKTTYSQLPQINERFWSHFIRGYFDGDGCITYSIGKTGKVTIASNKYILLEMIKKVQESIGVSFKLREKNDSEICYTMDIYNKEEIVKFMDWIYQDSEGIYLKRKYDHYQTYKNKYGIKQPKKTSPRIN